MKIMKKEQDEIKISVVVCTANYTQLFKKNIDSILKNNFDSFELIIVDQNKNNSVLDLINKYYKKNKKIIYVKDNKTGLSRARNIGWRKAKGEIISFTDDDAYVNKNWLKNIFYTFKKNNKIAIVGGRIIPLNENNLNIDIIIPKELQYILPSLDLGDNLKEYNNGNMPPGVNYSIRKKILEEVEGFDENFGPNKKNKIQVYGDDSDLTIRVKKEKYKIIYNPKVIVYHPVNPERLKLDFLKKRFFSEGYTDCLLFLKHNKVNFFNRIKIFINKFKELLIIFLNKNYFNKYVYEMNKNRILGYIYGVFNFKF